MQAHGGRLSGGRDEVMLLAGDIGGTKTMLALFSAESGTGSPLVEDSFPSSDFSSLEELVARFLAGSKAGISRASFGVAGPVSQGMARITNLPWDVSESRISKTLRIPEVRLINDLQALAVAVPHLADSDIFTINPGEGVAGGSIAVIAPGTGLGEAYLTLENSRYVPHASEGGHANFAPGNTSETGLLGYLQKEHDQVSVEMVCSGRGIPNIYRFLRESSPMEETPWLARKLSEVKDPTPVIIDAALDNSRPCPLCLSTLEMFVSIMGSEAGNLALKVLATGGVYLGGGIPPRILPALKTTTFMKAFSGKGRLKEIMDQMPVYVIINPKAALIGAACYGLSEL